MTTKDQTGDKLVASIRRTKAGAAKAGDTAPPAKPAARRPPTKTAQAPKRATAATRRTATADPYQSGGRIWPD
ncbi:MAG: hypothetical protein H6953_16770 [Chromatiaceae bacterium]|nr:hypothetical protein [Chromatiaceae bacterium]MCP5307091.1 hypothetical protein [Chromatiaceae bacterium]MCP5423253.1 hypothetical protein [Chromatiaceae bacterium]